MQIIELIYSEARAEAKRLMFAATLIGLSNAAILAVANAAAREAASVSLRLALLFVLAAVLFRLSADYLYRQTAYLVEDTLDRIKLRFTDKILQADLLTIETLGPTEIYDGLIDNATTLTAVSGQLARLLQLTVIVIFGGLYLAFLSPRALILVTIVAALGIFFVRARLGEIKSVLRAANKARVGFLDKFTDLVEGFKELKLRRQRREELRADITRTVAQIHDISVNANVLFAEKYIFGRLHFFAMLATIVFIFPAYDPAEVASHPQILAAFIFAYGPLNGLLAGLPTITRANIALENLATLEERLDQTLSASSELEVERDPWEGRFAGLELDSVGFAYEGDESGFLVGPIDLRIEPGELVFIVGGNGSGKSTLLRIIAGLYTPTVGGIRVGGQELGRENVQAYRELLSVIFADFHLFRRLYGLGDVVAEDVRVALDKLQLSHKTAFVDGRFSTLSLSTGQRKRLAMVVALLEDRPIYAFDEWAAEQDHEFRRYFYEELLLELKSQGKTVIVISHDDRYFHLADRLIKLERGSIQSITVRGAGAEEAAR